MARPSVVSSYGWCTQSLQQRCHGGTAFGSAMTLGCRHAIVVDLNTTGGLAAGPPTTMCHEGTGLHGSVDSYMRTRTDMRT